MTFETVGAGAEKLLTLAQKTSTKDTELAVQQLLTAAYALCLNEAVFRDCVETAVANNLSIE